MEAEEIRGHRLLNQQIAGTKFRKPEEIVAWMGAMQAQEFAMAKWAIGLRLPETTDALVETAFNKGSILRTHILRPTWHFVTPEDIRWMIALTAPRVNAANAFMYRKLELDQKVFKRTNSIITKMIEGEKQLTREELNVELERKKILAKGLRLGYIFMRAELDGIICSGPRIGKQFTYALLEERVPAVKAISRQESLSELTKLYFTSRGPASIQDFVTWSGLTVKEAKEGVSGLKDFLHEKQEAQTYIFKESSGNPQNVKSTFLMPDYDEYGMGYKDRSALRTTRKVAQEKISQSSDYTHWMIVDGVIEGSWSRSEKNKRIVIDVTPFGALNKSQHVDVKKAVDRYYSFVGQ
jgi:hypothetical protein